MTLPDEFIDDIKAYLPAEELDSFLSSISDTEQTTCIRYNSSKYEAIPEKPIPWNENEGAYLDQRPNFTLDPLMHAGCYYVQEASSQFVTHVIRQLIKKPVTALDLCAAPGGKSTAMLSALPTGSQLVSNEIDRRRARILAENITKWGNPNVTVTCNSPKDFIGIRNTFDLILTDVPCSGEGMFRKDEGAIADWSPSKVNNCVQTQREILSTIWPTLKSNGVLIYSTCTYNVHEDEEMMSYICNELGAEPISIENDEQWNIHKPLIGEIPCYRFMPHFTKGEGLFLAVVRKTVSDNIYDSFKLNDKKKKDKKRIGNTKNQTIDLKKITPSLLSLIQGEATIELTDALSLRAIPKGHEEIHDVLSNQGLYILQSGVELGIIKGKDIIPAHALALSTIRNNTAYPNVEVDKETALQYLRHEAIKLEENDPLGYVLICYQGHPLGFAKNMGNRSNNLYPQEWRIRFL